MQAEDAHSVPSCVSPLNIQLTSATVAHEDELIQISPDQFLTSVGPGYLLARTTARAIAGAFVCLLLCIAADSWYLLVVFVDFVEVKWMTRCIMGNKKLIYHVDSDKVELPLHTMHKAHKARLYLIAALLMCWAVMLGVSVYWTNSGALSNGVQLLFPVGLIAVEVVIQLAHRKNPRQYLEKRFKDPNGFPHLDKHIEFDL